MKNINHINTHEYIDNPQNNNLYVDLRTNDVSKKLSDLETSLSELKNLDNQNKIPRNLFKIASQKVFEKKLHDFIFPKNSKYKIAEFASEHSGQDSFLIIKNLLPYLGKSGISGEITKNRGILNLPFDQNVVFNSRGIIQKAENIEAISKDIYHYLTCHLQQDFASVLKKNDKFIYTSDLSRFEKTPKDNSGRNMFLGKDFLEFHSQIPVIGEKLSNIFQKMIAKFSDNSLNMLTVDLNGRGKYLDSEKNIVQRFERDKFIQLKDENENFAGFLGIADIFFQNIDENKSPFDGGKYSLNIETQTDLQRNKISEILDKNIFDSLISREISFEQKLKIIDEILKNADHYQKKILNYSAELNEKLFGKELELYGISYISDKCVNDCSYCGLSSKIHKKRKTLSKEEISRDFEAVLNNKYLDEFCILSGENPKAIIDYENSLQVLNEINPANLSRISLNIAPLQTDDFKKLVAVNQLNIPLQFRIFQESYDREEYAKYHQNGPKSDFNFRYNAQSRALQAGFNEIGLGVLMGLNTKNRGHDFEIFSLIKHAYALKKKHGKFPTSVSIPRHMPVSEFDFETPNPVVDEKYIFYHALLRLALPETKLMITSRESAEMIEKIGPFINIRDLAPRPGVGGNINPQPENFQNELGDTRNAYEIIEDLKNRGKLKNNLSKPFNTIKNEK